MGSVTDIRERLTAANADHTQALYAALIDAVNDGPKLPTPEVVQAFLFAQCDTYAQGMDPAWTPEQQERAAQIVFETLQAAWHTVAVLSVVEGLMQPGTVVASVREAAERILSERTRGE